MTRGKKIGIGIGIGIGVPSVGLLAIIVLAGVRVRNPSHDSAIGRAAYWLFQDGTRRARAIEVGADKLSALQDRFRRGAATEAD